MHDGLRKIKNMIKVKMAFILCVPLPGWGENTLEPATDDRILESPTLCLRPFFALPDSPCQDGCDTTSNWYSILIQTGKGIQHRGK
jgi:hypothetical protein